MVVDFPPLLNHPISVLFDVTDSSALDQFGIAVVPMSVHRLVIGRHSSLDRSRFGQYRYCLHVKRPMYECMKGYTLCIVPLSDAQWVFMIGTVVV